jgi:hypothetical protein
MEIQRFILESREFSSQGDSPRTHGGSAWSQTGLTWKPWAPPGGMEAHLGSRIHGYMEAHPWSQEGLPGVPGLIMPPWNLILEQIGLSWTHGS